MNRSRARSVIAQYRMMHFVMGWKPPALCALVMLFRREIGR